MRRPRPLAITGLLMLLLAGCGLRDARQLERQRAEQAQRQQALQRCERERRSLSPLVEALSRADDRLAVVEAEGYEPSPAPKPLDPEEQQRLAIYDQEMEQEQYDKAHLAWQQLESKRRALWRREHRERLAEARQQREAAAETLRAQAPALFSNPEALELNQAAVEQRLACAGPRP